MCPQTCEVLTVEQDGKRFHFKLVKSSSVMTYIKLKDNENQVYFLWQKVAEGEESSAITPAAGSPAREHSPSDECEELLAASASDDTAADSDKSL